MRAAPGYSSEEYIAVTEKQWARRGRKLLLWTCSSGGCLRERVEWRLEWGEEWGRGRYRREHRHLIPLWRSVSWSSSSPPTSTTSLYSYVTAHHSPCLATPSPGFTSSQARSADSTSIVVSARRSSETSISSTLLGYPPEQLRSSSHPCTFYSRQHGVRRSRARPFLPPVSTTARLGDHAADHAMQFSFLGRRTNRY